MNLRVIKSCILCHQKDVIILVMIHVDNHSITLMSPPPKKIKNNNKNTWKPSGQILVCFFKDLYSNLYFSELVPVAVKF